MEKITNVFEYDDYRTFLKETFQAIKASKPQVSHRFIAYRLGYKSSGAISLILSGRKNISLEKACQIIGFLKLSPEESVYFLDLVALSQNNSTTQALTFSSSFTASPLAFTS